MEHIVYHLRKETIENMIQVGLHWQRGRRAIHHHLNTLESGECLLIQC